MEFAQRMKDLALRSQQAAELALTEEATKTSVVMPFIQALGFDVFNLHEVVPEFTADVGIKKGERIDFAIRIGGAPAIIVEVKPISTALGEAQLSQLFRYFATLHVRLAILTNGKEVWFYSDIDESNRMDKKPFYIFDIQNHSESDIRNLSQFKKDTFNIDSIVESASRFKSTSKVSAFLSGILESPSDEFLKFVAKQINGGASGRQATEHLKSIVPLAFEQVVKNRIQDKLDIKFKTESQAADLTPGTAGDSTDSDVVTTEDELQAFYIVRAIGAKVAPVSRVTMRDAKSYCAVFVDDKNNRPVCRFYFNAKGVKRVGLFDKDKVESKFDIASPSDIFKYSDALEDVIKYYTS